MPSEETITRYLEKKAIAGPWRLEGGFGAGCRGAVVIPALGEGENLFATLASLAANPHDLLERFLVVAVVNHRPDAAERDREQNLRDLERLRAGVPGLPHLAVVDAASPGRDLPLKDGGVGLARRIGFDLALAALDHDGAEPALLVGLDADTLVDRHYLGALSRHFSSSSAAGAVLPFVHRPGATPAEEGAIRSYELFLRHYVLGLELAGSPYAFHTVGSALACTAAGYVRAGGMNRRKAGEDFYFLQELAKTGGVEPLRGTVVRPSARRSHRVPFGTGAAVSGLLAEEPRPLAFYPVGAFRVLKGWLELVRGEPGASAAQLEAWAGEVSPALAGFLREAGFARSWGRLQANHRDPARLERSFHTWFDALRTLRLIHHLCRQGAFGRPSEKEAAEALLAWAGRPLGGKGDPLLHLRRLQMGKGCYRSGDSVVGCPARQDVRGPEQPGNGEKG